MFRPAGHQPPPKATTGPAVGQARNRLDEDEQVLVAPRPKGQRAMDTLLQEMKARAPGPVANTFNPHSYQRPHLSTQNQPYHASQKTTSIAEHLADAPDDTTNLFVGNLPPRITEDDLGEFFAQRIGPVGSVKIMWPREDAGGRLDEARSLTGFVLFMHRRDAERAMKEHDRLQFMGRSLRVDWSKPTPVPRQAMWGIDIH